MKATRAPGERVLERLRHSREQREYRSLSQALGRMPKVPTTATLEAILLIELSERPRHVRAVERALALAGRRFPVARPLLPRTLGPLQLTDAPLDFATAAERAAEMLQAATSDRDVAVIWYGSANRQPGSSISYVEALALARHVLAESIPSAAEQQEMLGQ